MEQKALEVTLTERTDYMNVKEYLGQIELYDSKLEITRKEIEILKNKATKISSNINEKIQSSLIGDKIADNVIEYIDLEKKLELSERHFYAQRHKIINFIFKLKNPLHIKVLYKKYAEFKALPTVAREMKFSEQYVKEIHQEAIEELQKLDIEG